MPASTAIVPYGPRIPSILHHDWKPVLTLNTIVFALQLLFHLHDTQQLTDGDQEVRRLMDSGGGSGVAGAGGGLFDVLVQQTLDGGYYFGMRWERNRENTLADEQQQQQHGVVGLGADVEERKELSPRQNSKREGRAGMEDEDARKRRKRLDDAYSAAPAAEDKRERERGDEERQEEQPEEQDDDRHRKHKQPHRHFLHRQPSVSPPLPLLHAVHRIRRGQREERKEEDKAAAASDEDTRMARADSFTFTALQSSLPGPYSPVPLLHSAAITPVPPFSSISTPPSIYSASAPSSSARLFALSSCSSSSSSNSSPALGSLAAMQRQHAVRTTLGVGHTQLVGSRAGGSESGCDGGGVAISVVRTLSSVMAD